VSSIVVLGAGPIGAATTSLLAASGVVGRIVLVDPSTAVAQGIALDIQQCAPLHGSATRIDGTSDVGAVIGVPLVVLADRYGPAGEWRGDEALGLLTAVRGLNGDAVVLCGGAHHGDVVETMVRERDADPCRIAGSAPDALRHAMRALTALAGGASPRDVTLAVVGRPPREVFVPWEGASIGGSNAADVLSAPDITRLDRQLAALWPPGPLALGTAAADAARRYLTGARGRSCLFVVPEVRGGRLARGAAVPTSFGADGGVHMEWPVLSPRNRTRLESALAT
jgi:lactate/malate dehydrogenase, NAD binding domain